MDEKKQRRKKIEEIFTDSQVMMLLEDLRDDIRIIAEDLSGHKDNMENFRHGMDQFKKEMYQFKVEMSDFKKQTEENFLFLAKHLLKTT